MPWGQSQTHKRFHSSQHESLRAFPHMSWGPCSPYHLPTAVTSALLTCRPTRLLCSRIREWISL